MIDVMRSSVNTWECDSMGHMNVRHYSARAGDALARVALELGLGPRKLDELGLAVRASGQHLRFHREMRPGPAFRVQAGSLSASPTNLRVYFEMRRPSDDSLVAVFARDRPEVPADERAPLFVRGGRRTRRIGGDPARRSVLGERRHERRGSREDFARPRDGYERLGIDEDRVGHDGRNE
ncbi:MAG: thioesterase family protein, partial [Polyangiaceae bacterium]